MRVLWIIVVCVIFAWDQRRRGKKAGMHFAALCENWPREASSIRFLKQLHASLKAEQAKHEPDQLRCGMSASVDLAMAGGGMKCVYGLGAYLALVHAGIKVHSISGASGGALVASIVHGRTQYKLEDVLREPLFAMGPCLARVIREHKTLCLGRVLRAITLMFLKRIGKWTPPPNKLFVSVTTITNAGLQENITTRFDSSEDFINTLRASMSVPFLLCDGLFLPWRGRRAIDGCFKNNCPVSILSEQCAEADPEKRVILVIDCNKIARVPVWKKLLHIVYVPDAVSGELVLQGARDMLEALSSKETQVSGVTMIRRDRALLKRDFSYQIMPGKEHITRLLAKRCLI